MTTPLHTLLSRLEALEKEATPAPWEYDGKFRVGINGVEGWTGFRTHPRDAKLIVELRNACHTLTEIVKAQQDALELIVLQQDNFPEDAAENSINFAHEALARVNALASEIMKEGKP